MDRISLLTDDVRSLAGTGDVQGSERRSDGSRRQVESGLGSDRLPRRDEPADVHSFAPGKTASRLPKNSPQHQSGDLLGSNIRSLSREMPGGKANGNATGKRETGAEWIRIAQKRPPAGLRLWQTSPAVGYEGARRFLHAFWQCKGVDRDFGRRT